MLLVEGRREQDMSDEARRNMALELLHNRRFEEERQEWLKELRDEAFGRNLPDCLKPIFLVGWGRRQLSPIGNQRALALIW